MTDPIADTAQVLTYRATLADLVPTSLNHRNSLKYPLFQGRGVVISYQGNYGTGKKRTEGESPVHDHENDEVIKLIEGRYGSHNQHLLEIVEGYFLRIPAGVKHGGVSHGTWISIMPIGFRHVRTFPDEQRIEYESGSSKLDITFKRGDEGLAVGIENLVVIAEELPESIIVHGFNDPVTAELLRLDFK